MPTRDPARDAVVRFGNNAARRRDAAVQGLLRALVGGLSFTSEVALRQRGDLVRALDDLDVARLTLAELDKLDRETGARP